MSLLLIIVVLSTSTLADGKSLAVMASQAQVSLIFWMNSVGLSGLMRRVLAGQQGPPDLMQQETQSERNERVTRIAIVPGDLKVRLGERIAFEAVALDKAGDPVGGIAFQWEAQDVGRKIRARISPRGEFEARIPGTVIVTAIGAGQRAQTTVFVLEGVVPKLDATRETTKAVSSRDLPAKVEAKSSASVAPRLIDIDGGFDNTNYWSADDPGNRRGNPPGSPPDEGAGSGNFQLSAPVLELPSRGISLSLNLVYNSRLWNKAGSQITYDIDKDWPAPGWSIGFGKMMGMGLNNGTMLIDPDGTRHSYAGVVTFGYNNSYTYFNGHTSDGTLTDYSNYTGTGGALTWGEARRSDGTIIQYGASSQDALYPTRITDANGNFITITYVNNIGPQIQTITDTMGRTVSFHYDAYNLLTAIVGPGLTQGTRTLVRLHYRQIALNYGFAGLTARVRNGLPWVIDAIYYPGTGTGYWFGDNDSYSPYGMLAKTVEQRSMIFSSPSLNLQGMVAPGAMTEQMVYNYPQAPNYSLTDAPTFTTQTETWAFMDTAAAVTTYFLQPNASPRRTEITLPNGTRSVQLAFNAPGQFNDGMVFEDNTYDVSNNLLHKSTTSWALGAYGAARPVRIEMRDERGQVTATEFDYGPLYNQVTVLRSYDFGGVSLLRSAFMQYENSASYTSRHIFSLLKVAEVYTAAGIRASRTEYQFDGQTLTDTPGVIMHSDAYNPYAPVYLVPGYCYYVCDEYCYVVCEPDYYYSDFDPSTTFRGNVTQVTTYADAAYLNGPVTETRRYDIDGNMVASSTSCCDQTSHSYTLATQYAYPVSVTQGAIANPAAQVSVSDAYDFNTGLIVNSTDFNGRASQTTYFAGNLRPQYEYTPTGAFTINAYDESAMSISETTYTAGGGAIAAQKVSFLDGLGSVRREEALTEGGLWDVVEARNDALGRLWRQSRPYRNGQEQPQWTVITFDALSRVTRVQAPDGSETNMFYNEASRPDVATPGLQGEVVRMVDSWGRERWRLADANKRLVEVVEPNPAGNGSVATGGLLTRYSYDGLDKLAGITQGNQSRSFRFDALGRMTHQKLSEAGATLNDAGQFVGNGLWSEVSTYDERSNLTSRTDARGIKTVFAYNSDPLNRMQSMSYDTLGFGDTGNPIVAAPTITYEYVTTGDVRRISRLTTSGVSTEDFSYDVEGRVSGKTVTLALRPSYPMITDYIYDSLDRLTDVRYPAEYSYGGAPRKVVHHSFDVASRLRSVQVDGVNYASQVGYNASSQVASLSVGTNQVTETYTYDAVTGFLTGQKVQRGAATLLDLGYDYLRPNTSTGRTSQLTRISNNLDHYKDRSYAYDALGRLSQAAGGPSTWTENYAYDRYGNRTSVTSAGYAAVTYPPTCSPTQILWVDQFVRNFYQGALNRQPNSSELQYWANLIRQAYSQGQQRLLSACQSFGWALFQSQEYANRVRSNSDYVYDLYWAYLQRAPDQGGWNFWTGQVGANGRDQVRRAFDLSGEFSTKVASLCPGAGGVPVPRDGLAAVSYDTTSNRINTPGFAYDAAGNQTRVQRSDGSWQRLQYDAGGRLANVKNDNGLVLAVYTYGTRNRRLITQEGESSWNLRTYYAWDGEDVIAEYTESNATPLVPQWSKSYVYLYDRLLATLQPGASSEYVQYDHPDRLGTRLISNASDTYVQEQVTLPFGTALDAESTGVIKKRFTSYDRGSTTGLDYAINRHYDSQQGRFTQVDPIGMDSASLLDPQSLNMYAYCGNDPINRVDPDGQFWGKLFKGLLKIFKIFNKIIKIIAIAAIVALGVALAATGLGAVAFAKIAFLVAKALFGVLKFISTAISAIAGKIAGIFNFAAFAFAEGGTRAGISGLGLLQSLGAIAKQLAKRQRGRRNRRREIERRRIEIVLKDAKAIMDALAEQAKKLLCKTQGERSCQIQWSIDMGQAEEQYYRTLGGCSTPWCVWYAQKEYDRAKARIGDQEGKCLFEANDKCGTKWP